MICNASVENKTCVGILNNQQATELVAADYSCIGSGTNKGVQAYINSSGKLAVRNSRGSKQTIQMRVIANWK